MFAIPLRKKKRRKTSEVTFTKKYKFPQEFSEWETKCNAVLKGSAIGTTGSKSLYEFVSNHGFKSPEKKNTRPNWRKGCAKEYWNSFRKETIH